MDAQETRRLHELAAKAVGLSGDYRYCNSWDGMAVWNDTDGGWFDWRSTWRPLVDDGDSRRLEVALEMNVYINDRYCIAEILSDGDEPPVHKKEYCNRSTKAAATRLVVLRAAAAIGESMQKGDEDGRYLVVEEIPPQEWRENWMGDPPDGGFENYVKNYGQPLKFREKP